MAKPLQTVGSLVQRYRDIGKTEDQIAAEFEKFYGAPHWNLPSDTPLRQARLQSPREIKKRGTPMPGSYEEIFFPPEQRAFAKMAPTGAVDQLTPEPAPAPEPEPEAPEAPPPSGPSLDEMSDSGEAAEFQQKEGEIADAVRESMQDTEIRGGLYNTISEVLRGEVPESAKRTAGFVQGGLQRLWEATPWGEPPPPSDVYGSDIRTDESVRSYSQRKALEAKQLQQFLKVQQDPNHGVMDLVRATPAWQNMQEGNKERTVRADRPGWSGIAGRLGNAVEDIGDLVMFLPRLGYSPVSSFEVPKEMGSQDYGKQVGKEFVPAMGVALAAPYLSPLDSFKVAPFSTLMAWLPGLQMFGKGLKAIPGIRSLSLQRFNSTVGELLPRTFAKVVDGVSKKFGGGITTQSLMDRFYSGDPAVTALLEEAFGQDADVQRAMGELSDVLAAQRTKELGVQTAIHKAGMAGDIAEMDRLENVTLRVAERKVNAVLQDVATALKRLNYMKPDGTPFASIDEMVTHLRKVLQLQMEKMPDQFALHDPKNIALALNGDKRAFAVLQEAMKQDPTLNWDKLNARLTELGMGPGDPVYDRLANAAKTLSTAEIDLNPSRVRQMLGTALRDEAVAASEKNAGRVLGREASKYSPPPEGTGPVDPNSPRVHNSLLEADDVRPPRDPSFDPNTAPIKTLTPAELAEQAKTGTSAQRQLAAETELLSRKLTSFSYQEALDEMARLRDENAQLEMQKQQLMQQASDAMNSNIDPASLQTFIEQSEANILELEKRTQRNTQRLAEFDTDVTMRKNLAAGILEELDLKPREATTQSVLTEYEKSGQLPQVINTSDIGSLIMDLKGIGTKKALELANHLKQMGELQGMKEAGVTHGSSYVTWLQDQKRYDKVMSSGFAKLGQEANAWVKANVLPANWKAIFSNLIGNSVAVAAKMGWTSHPWEEMGRTFANMLKYKLFKSGKMAETDAAFRPMRALSRSGIINTDAFSADLLKYQSALDPQSLVGKAGAAVATGPAKIGGAAMVGMDQGAKARVFVAKFEELGKYADGLKEGEFVQYPSGPNTITKLERIPDPVDPRVTNRFRETTYVRDMDKKGGLRQVGEAKEFLRDGGEGGLQFDDAIAKGAGKFATDFIFDYDRVPGLIQWQRRMPIVGAGSPFSTFAFKALEIPGVKRGLPSVIMSATDGVVSNSSKVNLQLARKAGVQWIRQNLIAAGARATAQDEDRKRMMSFDPSRPDTVEVMGPASGSQLADVTVFTSANWAEGLQTVLMTLQSAAQQMADKKGSAEYDNFVKLNNEMLKYTNADKEPPEQLMQARKNAYLLALGEMKDKALTPEVTPQLMKLAGLGGTVFFDTYAAWRDAGKTGKSAPTFASLTKLLIPGLYRAGIESAVAENYPVEKVPFVSDMLNEMVEGKMARGVPREGTDPSGFTKDEHVGVRMLLENVTGLQAVRVDTQSQAERMKKAMQKELEGKLEMWGKEREARLKLQLGDRDGALEAIKEKEILKEMVKNTVNMWYDKQLERGFAGRQPKAEKK